MWVYTEYMTNNEEENEAMFLFINFNIHPRLCEWMRLPIGQRI